jgi:subtilisin-like proprotein convertase family protein
MAIWRSVRAKSAGNSAKLAGRTGWLIRRSLGAEPAGNSRACEPNHVPKIRALLGFGVVVAAMAVGAVTASAASAAPPKGEILAVGTARAVPNSYIVVLNKGAVSRDAVPGKADALAHSYGGRRGRTYQNALRGFEINMPERAAQRLAADPAVAFVQQNGVHNIAGTQSPTPSWGLDRIDQRSLPLNNSYTFPNTASLVKAYIIDTGIRFSHVDFGGRAISGFDAIDGGAADDLNGHGTHVAGTVGGTTYGVAKSVVLVGVRVLDASGFGTTDSVVAGIDWVTGNHRPGEPAVANMSLGGGTDSILDSAVTNSIASGVTYGVAAGNSNANACTFSPARVPTAITVGATDITDARASFSNFGSCLHIFAPGVNITSDWNTGDTATNTISGTSMATPHVVGAAALVLKKFPTYTPAQVRSYLVDNASNGKVISPGTGSPNKLLFVVNTAPVANDYRLSASPASGTVSQGNVVSTTILTAITAGASRPITLTATGLPSGTSVAFTPSTINTGSSSTMQITTSSTTPVGQYSINVIGTGTSPTVVRTTTYLLNVIGPPGCSGTNPTDVPISDFSTVESTITITGCPGQAGTGSAISVNIMHTFISDLVVTLVAPDGTGYVLHNHTGGSSDNIIRTYTLNLSSELANGTWRLEVSDTVGADVGFINSWGVNLATMASACIGTNNTDVPIPDLGTAQSNITFATCNGFASSTSMVEVHIVHTFIGDLVVTLVAPDGTSYVLQNRVGGSADNIDQVYPVDLSSELRNGTWRLVVQDMAAADTGFINSWSLSI